MVGDKVIFIKPPSLKEYGRFRIDLAKLLSLFISLYPDVKVLNSEDLSRGDDEIQQLLESIIAPFISAFTNRTIQKQYHRILQKYILPKKSNSSIEMTFREYRRANIPVDQELLILSILFEFDRIVKKNVTSFLTKIGMIKDPQGSEKPTQKSSKTSQKSDSTMPLFKLSDSFSSDKASKTVQKSKKSTKSMTKTKMVKN